MVIPTSFSTPTLIDCSCLDLDLKNKEKRSSSGSSWCWGAFIVSPPSQSSSLLHILMPVPNVPTIILTVQSGHGESQRCVSPPSDVHFSKMWNRERCSAGTPGPRATRSWAEIPATREPRMLAYATPISAHRHVLCIPSQKTPRYVSVHSWKVHWFRNEWYKLQTQTNDFAHPSSKKKSHETKQPMKYSIFNSLIGGNPFHLPLSKFPNQHPWIPSCQDWAKLRHVRLVREQRLHQTSQFIPLCLSTSHVDPLNMMIHMHSYASYAIICLS